MMTSPRATILQFFFFFFNDTATTEIYTLSLHDALPICEDWSCPKSQKLHIPLCTVRSLHCQRSEEHTSELQSQSNLVCRLLLEKKKMSTYPSPTPPPRLAQPARHLPVPSSASRSDTLCA